MSRQKSPEKIQAILDGAMQVFVSHGYAAASMDQIAATAGVSKPTLYNYFKNKEGLFTALIEQMVSGDSIHNLLGDRRFIELPLRDSLKELAYLLLDKFSNEKPLFTLFRLLIGESGRFPNLAQTFICNIEKPLLEELTYLFANHSDSKTTEPGLTARFFHGSIVHYVIVQEILHGQEILPLERDYFINNLINVLLNNK